MPNVTFTGFEATITIAGATVAVAEEVTVKVAQELEAVRAIGNHKPADLKEVFQLVTWELKKAYFKDATAADLFPKATRDANGYLSSFTMTIRFRDLSTGSPVDQTYTVTGCKTNDYGITVPAGRGVIVETIKGEAIDSTRA